MFTCSICGPREGREEFVDEVFRINGKYVLIDQIPARVCARCREETLSR